MSATKNAVPASVVVVASSKVLATLTTARAAFGRGWVGTVDGIALYRSAFGKVEGHKAKTVDVKVCEALFGPVTTRGAKDADAARDSAVRARQSRVARMMDAIAKHGVAKVKGCGGWEGYAILTGKGTAKPTKEAKAVRAMARKVASFILDPAMSKGARAKVRAKLAELAQTVAASK